jgi:protein-S-isoprenylcysteine O-methyltransferase Ste14
MLLSATILSVILISIVRDFVGVEIVIPILLFPAEIIAPYPINLIGLLVLVLGFILIITANFHLLMIGKIGLEDREPFHTPSTIVTSGPYQYSRNPILSSIALFLFFWKAFVSWEEKKLEEKFGEEYLEYKRRVRRWI